MALNPSTNATMSGRVTAADADYPRGSSKDETAPGAGDGTPYFKGRADDIFGLQQALLRTAGIVPSGDADTALLSEYLKSIVELVSGRAFNYDDSGVADAYVLDIQSNQQAPAGLFNGLEAKFLPSNNNTGASTANAFGSGVIDIKLKGGLTDPDAGDLSSLEFSALTYRTTPGVHWELTSKVADTVVPATETEAGIAEIATQAETDTGTDDSRFVTPLKLGNLLPGSATESDAGIAEIATAAEAIAGTDDATIITPLKLRNGLNASGTAPIFASRAWVVFDGTGTVSIYGSGNVSSITDNAAGRYTTNFTTNLPSVNYCAVSNAKASGTSVLGVAMPDPTSATRTVSAYALKTSDESGNPSDLDYVNIAFLDN